MVDDAWYRKRDKLKDKARMNKKQIGGADATPSTIGGAEILSADQIREQIDQKRTMTYTDEFNTHPNLRVEIPEDPEPEPKRWVDLKKLVLLHMRNLSNQTITDLLIGALEDPGTWLHTQLPESLAAPIVAEIQRDEAREMTDRIIQSVRDNNPELIPELMTQLTSTVNHDRGRAIALLIERALESRH